MLLDVAECGLFCPKEKGWKIPKKMPISHLGTEAPGKSVVRYWGQAPRGGNSTWVNVPFLSRFCHVFCRPFSPHAATPGW